MSINFSIAGFLEKTSYIEIARFLLFFMFQHQNTTNTDTVKYTMEKSEKICSNTKFLESFLLTRDQVLPSSFIALQSSIVLHSMFLSVLV